MSARITLNLSNLRGAGRPHSGTSQRNITSDETVTPPEPTDPGCLKKMGQLRYIVIFKL